MDDPIWIEISKSSIKHNIAVIRSLIGDKVILAPCVKSNAYGHGIVGIVKLLVKYGIDFLCVNSLIEAQKLRAVRIENPILIISSLQKLDLENALRIDARLFVYDRETATTLSKLATNYGKLANVHIKVDTGMCRQGLPMNEFEKFLDYVHKLENVKIEGVATHFATSDQVEDDSHFRKQLDNFNKIIGIIKKKNIEIPLLHCANSGAVLLHPETHFNLVRPGLSIYGYYSSKEVEDACKKKNIKLIPSLTLKTKITAIKEIPENSQIGYSCTYTTKRKTKIAVLPIGYHDGLNRKLSNNGHVLINNHKADIIGIVSMNITVVDVTNIPNVSIDDEVVIIGQQQNESITIEEIAKMARTNNYEIIARLPENIPRYYIK